MHYLCGGWTLCTRLLAVVVWGDTWCDLYIPHAAVYVCQWVHLYGNKEGGALRAVPVEESEKVDGALSLGVRHRHHHQTLDRGTCICAESCDNDVVCEDVLSSRGWILPLVYLGIVVDVRARTPLQKQERQVGTVCRGCSSALCARVLARSVLPKTVSIHADILYAGRGMLRLERAAFFYEESADMECAGMLCSRWNYDGYGNSGGQIGLLLPYLGIAAVMSVSSQLERWRKGTWWLIVVSCSSYIIYLFHTTFEGFAKAVVHKVPIFADGSNEQLFVVNVTIVVLCGVLCPIVLHRCILNKTNVTKILFGLK